jgi:hypothetical protein
MRSFGVRFPSLRLADVVLAADLAGLIVTTGGRVILTPEEAARRFAKGETNAKINSAADVAYRETRDVAREAAIKTPSLAAEFEAADLREAARLAQ